MKRRKAGRAFSLILALVVFCVCILSYAPQKAGVVYASEDGSTKEDEVIDDVDVIDDNPSMKNETTSEDFSWGGSGKTCTVTTAITGYKGTSNIVTIPKKCTMIYMGAISANVRKNNADITTLKFKESSECTEIGDYAFYGMNTYQSSSSSLLGTVDLSNSKISSIGKNAFQYCKNINSITWPTAGTMKTIGDYCFEQGQALTGINIPSTVGVIGKYAFANNAGLRTAVTYGSLGEYAFAYDKVLDNAEINGDIGEYCFYGDTALKSVKINASKISDNAFLDDTKLENVDFTGSTGLKTIGSKAFSNCNIKGIIIPGTVTSIGEAAFMESNLSDVTFVDQSDLVIGKDAFLNNNLNSATLPENCVSVGEFAFSNNPLKSVNIGYKLDTIGEQAFNTDGTLGTVNVNGVPGNVSDEGIFTGSNLETVVFSEKINKVANNLFRNSHFNNVVRLILPDNIQVIGANAFKNVTGLGSVKLPDSIIEIQDGAFDTNNPDFYVLVNEGAESFQVLKDYNEKHNDNPIQIKIQKDDGTIVNPEDIDKPDVPDKPDDPDVPDKPVDPDKPDDPDGPVNPDKPDDPIADQAGTFEITIKYYDDALEVKSNAEVVDRSKKDDKGVTVITEKIRKKTDGTKNSVIYDFVPLGDNKIESVYVDSVCVGAVDSYSFIDDYNHEIIINMQEKTPIFVPIEQEKAHTIDIFFYPDSVNVSGPDIVHTFKKIDDYAFLRYYLYDDSKQDFYFERKNDSVIEKVIVDGKDEGNITKYSFNDNVSHKIIIQTKDKPEIPEDVSADKQDEPTEPSNREYDDDGNIIDKNKPMHSITYNLAGGTNSPYNYGYYYEGSVFYFRNPTKAGCIFEGWYSGNTKVVSTKNCTTNLKLTAKWKVLDYTITYELNGGHFKKPQKVVTTYNISKTIKLQKPVKDGYTFIGWFYGDAQIKKLKKTDAIKGTITLVAKWTPNTYTIKYKGGRGVGKMPSTTNCIYDQVVVLPICTMSKTGKTFAGWNTKKNGTGTSYSDGAKVISLKKKGTIYLYAQWK